MTFQARPGRQRLFPAIRHAGGGGGTDSKTGEYLKNIYSQLLISNISNKKLQRYSVSSVTTLSWVNLLFVKTEGAIIGGKMHTYNSPSFHQVRVVIQIDGKTLTLETQNLEMMLKKNIRIPGILSIFLVSYDEANQEGIVGFTPLRFKESFKLLIVGDVVSVPYKIDLWFNTIGLSYKKEMSLGTIT